MGLDDLRAGNLESSLEALTYAAEGGQAIARWKLGEMYADGVGVARDDLKAYHYFNQVVEDYDEDQPDRRSLSLVANAFVAVGVYCLNGIPNSDVRPDPERAHELFQYAATNFGDPNAEYNLANMYLVGAGVVPKDKGAAVRWLALAAAKGHRSSEALLGHMLFNGDGVAHQRARGLMWLEVAIDGSQDPKDEWIREPPSARLRRGERRGPPDGRRAPRRARQRLRAFGKKPSQVHERPAAGRGSETGRRAAAADGRGSMNREAPGAFELFRGVSVLAPGVPPANCAS